MYDLIVNANNPLIGKLLVETEDKKQDELIKQVYDLARLSRNLLKGKELNDFVKRSVNIIE